MGDLSDDLRGMRKPRPVYLGLVACMLNVKCQNVKLLAGKVFNSRHFVTTFSKGLTLNGKCDRGTTPGTNERNAALRGCEMGGRGGEAFGVSGSGAADSSSRVQSPSF